MHSILYRVLSNLVAYLFLTLAAAAQPPWQFDTHTRYMALGDSLAAGIGAIPATQGYVYLLYQDGVFNPVPQMLFANAGVPGVTSKQVLDYQVPQVASFQPTVITLSVGANDLIAFVTSTDHSQQHLEQVLAEFANNLTTILITLHTSLPTTRIYMHNLYSFPEIPESVALVQAFNVVLSNVVTALRFPVGVADVYSAFLGRQGLLLVERHGAAVTEVHPTNAGYRVIEQAFMAVIR